MFRFVSVLTKSGPMGGWRRAKTEVSPTLKLISRVQAAKKKELTASTDSVSGHHIKKRVERDGGMTGLSRHILSSFHSMFAC